MYSVSEESKDKCDDVSEAVVIWHKIVKSLAAGWHKKYKYNYTELM